MINAHAVFNSLINNPDSPRFQKYHLSITDTTTSCWTGPYTPSKDKVINSPAIPAMFKTNAVMKSSIAPTLCSDPENHLFWDGVHPTKQIHMLLYNILMKDLGATKV